MNSEILLEIVQVTDEKIVFALYETLHQYAEMTNWPRRINLPGVPASVRDVEDW